MGMSDLADLFTSLFLKKLWCSNIFFKPWYTACHLEMDTTSALLQRKNFMLQDYACVMCGLQDHLFFQCPLAILC
jgi:hypothetical protein